MQFLLHVGEPLQRVLRGNVCQRSVSRGIGLQNRSWHDADRKSLRDDRRRTDQRSVGNVISVHAGAWFAKLSPVPEMLSGEAKKIPKPERTTVWESGCQAKPTRGAKFL